MPDRQNESRRNEAENNEFDGFKQAGLFLTFRENQPYLITNLRRHKRKLKRTKQPLSLNLCFFRYSVMSECWSEKPEDRPTFPWICTAMRRLMADHKVYLRNEKDSITLYPAQSIKFWLVTFFLHQHRLLQTVRFRLKE